MRAPLVSALLLAASIGCTSYEYEEEVFLGIDGSGSIRISGSREMWEALHDLDSASVERLRDRLDATGIEVISIRETEREGRTFLHAQARFEDWNELCRHRAFRDRRCSFGRGLELGLELALPRPGREPPAGVDSEALLAFRFHLPSTVHYHNTPSGIERGNILSWTRSVREHFSGRPLAVEIRFDRRSTLATTAGILLLAVGLVAATVVAALYWMVRKGRSQLASEREGLSGSLSTPPSRP